MAANGPNKTTSPLSIIAILAVLVGAAYVTRSPMESPRPEAPPDLKQPVREEDKIDARLWQDPLKVALDHKKAMHGEKNAERPKCPSIHDVNQVREVINDLTDKGTKNPNDQNTIMHVLLTMVRGGPYSEDHERRLRNRYAMLTALHSSGFTPVDTKYIGYFRLEWTKSNELENNNYREVPKIDKVIERNLEPLLLPFEWFVREELYRRTSKDIMADDRPEHVLVVWLPESDFSNQPLTRLAQVIDALGHAHSSGVRIDMIGPSHSGTLREMLSEIGPIHDSKGKFKDANYVDVNGMLNGLTIYSPWSTASPALLRPKESWPVSDPSENSISEMYEVIHQDFNEVGIKFIRTIGSDDLLAMHLIQELDRRGVDVIGGIDYVALISEWDIFYGKAFPLTFATMMESMKHIDPNTDRPSDWNGYAYNLNLRMPRECDRNFPNNLLTFNYLRGIDGRLPRSESSEDQKPSKKTEITSQLTFTKSPELPIGRSQLDYIRRLAQKLSDEYQVKAFGVVGTDVYDKLLLIRALREQLGSVIIFTIDLDTRMMHSGQCKWTRNVIVASNFGLELNEEYQHGMYHEEKGSLPPFRDNYQTALFFSCRAALGLRTRSGKLFRKMGISELTGVISHPRLFEIGRECAVNLSVDDTPIHPPRRSPNRNLQKLILLISLAIVLYVLLLVQFSSMVRKVVAGINPLRWDIVGFTVKVFGPVMIVAVTWFVVVVIDEHYYEPTGEPFSLVSGVSIWPGEALQLLVVILSLCFILKSMHDLKANEKELCKWFNPKKPEKFRRDAISCKRKSFRLYSGKGVKKRVQGQELWKNYLQKGSLHRRINRVLLMSFMYLLLPLILILIFGPPNMPYRGRVSFIMHKILLIFSTFFMIFLIFFVMDATQQSLKFIRHLKVPVTSWPKKLVERFKVKETTGLKETKGLKETDGLAEWHDIKFIASHTEAVGKLIYYPFIVLLIMFLSRNRYFDNWDFPISLIIISLINFTYALVSAILLRRVAEQSRRMALDRLQEKLVHSTGAGLKDRTKQLETMIEEIKLLQRGAFSSFMENPVIHVLFGSGGAGLLVLLKYIPF